MLDGISILEYPEYYLVTTLIPEDMDLMSFGRVQGYAQTMAEKMADRIDNAILDARTFGTGFVKQHLADSISFEDIYGDWSAPTTKETNES